MVRLREYERRVRALRLYRGAERFTRLRAVRDFRRYRVAVYFRLREYALL